METACFRKYVYEELMLLLGQGIGREMAFTRYILYLFIYCFWCCWSFSFQILLFSVVRLRDLSLSLCNPIFKTTCTAY